MEQTLTLARLIIREWDWLWAAVPIVVAALLILGWGYRQTSSGAGGARFVAGGLKIIGLLALAFFLLDPHWSEHRSLPRANLFFVLADNSRSLTITDRDESNLRGHRMRQLLFGESHADLPDTTPGDQGKQDKKAKVGNAETGRFDGTLISPWAVKLVEQFDTRAFAFDARLRHLDRRDVLIFDGDASALMTALSTLKERYRSRPVAGVLLFTDGNVTDLPDGPLDLTGLPPVYPVVMGKDDATTDIRIENVAVAQTAFEDAPVTITADGSTHGFNGQTVSAKLIDAKGEVVEQQTVDVDSDEKSLAFRFQFKPKTAGLSFYQLIVSRPQDTAAVIEAVGVNGDKEKTFGEATIENNTQLIAIDRGQGPYRILYVSGRPNWEYKFLSRAVVDDPQLDVVGLIRIARREPKFKWRRKGENETNPLFQGFDDKKEEIEQYDEPVLVRMHTRDDAELRNGFPKTPDDLFGYHAVIIDDLEAAFFTRDQMALLDKFVTRRRGGLLMLGGTESLREGAYQQTPIGRMLPVYLDRTEAAPHGPFRYELTRVGRHEAWMRLRGSEADEIQRVAAMPDFRTINAVFGIKPGATTVASVRDTSGAVHPALVVQSFGGRVGVMTMGDQWRWALHRPRSDDPEKDDRLYDQARMWRQTLRWLVADVPQRVELSASQTTSDAGQSRLLKVILRDKQFQPIDNATVTLKVTSPDDKTIEITADPADEPGVYQSSYLPRIPGAYRVHATAVDGQGESVGEANVGWAQNTAGREFHSIKPNRTLLKTIADKTGGEIVDAEDLDSFVASLPTKKSPVMEMSVEPLWDRWWVFAIALFCLAGEWGIRRLKGLP